MSNHKSTRTRDCAHCGQPFPLNVTVNGERKHFHKRKYCFECSPLGGGNRKTLELHTATRRVCSGCSEEKPVSEFFKRPRGDYKSFCKACHGKEGTKLRKQYKQQAVVHMGGECQKCGYKRCNRALEFHHIDPSQKDFTFSGARRSFESSKAELDKCTMLCANCHREEHERTTHLEYATADKGVLDPVHGFRCPQCDEVKAESEFGKRRGGKRHPWCKHCKKTYQQQRRREIKQETVDYKGGKCQLCGYSKSLDALEFHHKDPTQKDLGVAELRKKLSAIKDEVDKCILVCCNCHRELHEAFA